MLPVGEESDTAMQDVLGCATASVPSPVHTRKMDQVSWPLELHVVPYTTLLNSSMVRFPGAK